MYQACDLMASPRKRGREDRFDFLRSIAGADGEMVDAAIRACERLTDQQLQVIKQIRAPQIAASGRATLILAAAASGKTSTMLAVVEALCAFGHGKPFANQFTLFAMFNKTAAADGNKRMAGELDEVDGSVKVPGLSPFARKSVDCRTSHSAVLKHTPELQGNVRFRQGDGGHIGPKDAAWTCLDLSQEKMEKLVLKYRAESIRDFVLCGAAPPIDLKGRKALRRDEELCAFWIYKTWLNWVHKAGGEAALGPNEIDPVTRIGKLTYYPIVKNHTSEGGEGKARRKRLAGTHPGTFYTSEALALWRRMMEAREFWEHDAYLKYAEVAKVRFSRHSTILLDESQDLTECQVQVFVVNQSHADVYVVGDAVQSLYSWRGARPKQLRTLSQRLDPHRAVKEDLQLTRSHRFGSGIARIANHITFIKKNSAQHTLWHHYTVVGAGPPTLQLLDGKNRESRLAGETPRTVVGRTNAGLIIEAIEVLSEDASTSIGLLGKGSYDKFEGICRDVLELLPYAEDRERPFHFKGGSYDNWEDFEQEVEDREMPYGTHLSLIGKFAEEGDLRGLIGTFRHGVLQQRRAESECTVLLATACGAKGLEWDNVKVLNDYTRLMTFERVPEKDLIAGSDYACIHHGSAHAAPIAAGTTAETLASPAIPMRFGLPKDWKGDELNSWYVAITRARVRLELPERFWHLYRAVWHGEGYSAEKGDKNAPQHSPEEVAGINAVLGKMRHALPPAGPEIAAAPASPPTPATMQAAGLGQLHVASVVAPQALQFD